jgi:hypothetical protein
MGWNLTGALRCGECGKRYTNPLAHTCAPRSDFKARRRQAATAEKRRKRKAVRERQAARRKQAAADRRARDKARKAAAKKTRPSRPRGESHEPGTCGDRECQKYGCKAYWQGMGDCPGPHEGE